MVGLQALSLGYTLDLSLVHTGDKIDFDMVDFVEVDGMWSTKSTLLCVQCVPYVKFCYDRGFSLHIVKQLWNAEFEQHAFCIKISAKYT